MKNSNTKSPVPASQGRATPVSGQKGSEIQKFGTVVDIPTGLDAGIRSKSVDMLNQVLADTMAIRDLYKKHHWQVSGPTFYQLHLLFDKHYEEQAELIDTIAERIQILGGLGVAMGADVAEMTKVERPPKGREEAPVQISRLLAAHEIILKESRESSKKANDAGDDGTTDLLISDVIRTNELQVWFISEHLVNLPIVIAD